MTQINNSNHLLKNETDSSSVILCNSRWSWINAPVPLFQRTGRGNLRTALMALVCIFTSGLGIAHGNETITVNGKIEKIDLFERIVSIAVPGLEANTGDEEKPQPTIIELELTRKTKIISKAVAVGTDAIKPGSDAIVKYNSKLMVVVSIEFGPRLEAVNLQELNSPMKDFAPCVTSDGLEIFWATETLGRKSIYTLWHARRKSTETLFDNKKQLFSGQAPVLSSDGLELLFRDSASESINLATRKSRDEDFGRPVVVQSLTFPQRDPSPTWLTADGLTLYLDFAIRGGKDLLDCWVVTRDSISSAWNPAKRVEARFEGMLNDFHFYSASATSDNLRLYCVSDHGMGILSRTQPSGPFTQWDEIYLTSPDGSPAYCLKHQYIPATRELFLSSNNIFPDPATKRKRWADLWVIKDFQPPAAVSQK